MDFCQRHRYDLRIVQSERLKRYKLTDQNQDSDLFIPFYDMENTPVNSIITSVRPVLSCLELTINILGSQ